VYWQLAILSFNNTEAERKARIQAGEPKKNTPSEDDVKNVRRLLQTLLPLELTDLVIEHAEYWPCLHSESRFSIELEAKKVSGLKAAGSYLVSPPIP
jgi:hypothetical protein